VKHFYPNKLSVKHTLKNTCSLLALIHEETFHSTNGSFIVEKSSSHLEKHTLLRTDH